MTKESRTLCVFVCLTLTLAYSIPSLAAGHTCSYPHYTCTKPLKAHRFINLAPYTNTTKPTFAYSPVGMSGWADKEIYYQDGTYIKRSSITTGHIHTRYHVEHKLSVPLLVTKDHTYAATVEGKLLQFDRLTGSKLWQMELSSPVRTQMLYSTGSIYFASHLGQVFKVDTSLGKITWVASLSDKASISIRQNQSLILHSSSLWVGGKHTMEAFSKDTGEPFGPVRTFQKTFRDINTIVGSFIHANLLIFARFDGHIFAYDLTTASLNSDLVPLWKQSIPGYISSLAYTTQNGGYIYLGSVAGEIFQVPLTKTSATTATASLTTTTKEASHTKTQKLTNASITSITALDSTLLLSTNDGEILGVSYDLKEIHYYKKTLSSFHAAPLIIKKTLAYFVSGYGNIYSYALPSHSP